jgi:hypothetical protein
VAAAAAAAGEKTEQDVRKQRSMPLFPRCFNQYPLSFVLINTLSPLF